MTSAEQILEYLAINGPTFGPEMMEALGWDTGSVTARTAALLDEGLIVVEKKARTGGNRCVNEFRLPTPEDEAIEGQPHVVRTKAVDGQAPAVPSGFSWANPFAGSAAPALAAELMPPDQAVSTLTSSIDVPRLGVSVSIDGITIGLGDTRLHLDRVQAARLKAFMDNFSPALFR